MPLARITALSPADAEKLEQQLRARGFDVETVSPEQSPSHPADLEITLEECGLEQVVGRAESLGQSQDLSVFIAAGAITDMRRPERLVRLAPEFSPAAVADVPAVHELLVETNAEAAEAEFQTETEAEAVKVESSTQEISVSVPVGYSEPEACAGEELPEVSTEAPVELAASPKDPVEPEPRPIGEPEPDPGPVEEPNPDPEPEHVYSGEVETEPVAPELVFSAMSVAPDITEPERAEADLQSRAPEMENLIAELEAIMPDLKEPVGAEGIGAREKAEELWVENAWLAEDALANVNQFATEQNAGLVADEGVPNEPVSDWPIWQPESDDAVLRESLAASQQSDLAAAPQPSLIGQQVIRLTMPTSATRAYMPLTGRLRALKDEKLFWRTATAASMAAVIVALGLVLGISLHRRSPLPEGLLPGVQPVQEIRPVKAVKRLPVAITSNAPKALTPVPVKTSAPPVKQAAVRQPASESEFVAPDTVVRYDHSGKSSRHGAGGSSAAQAPAASRTHPAARPHESDVVAEDTVVRYSKQTANSPGQPRR